MADIRTTISSRSRTPGTRVGTRVNSFGLKGLRGITGEEIAVILLHAMEPAFEQAHSEWPVQTGASRDSMDLRVAETGPKHARVILGAGGDKLIKDERNISKRDYAPFIEFNGTATVYPGTLFNAVNGNDRIIKERIKEGLKRLIRSKIRG